MDWVERFHARQHEWTGVYAEPIRPKHREKAGLVEELGGEPPLRILELGCGGGQVATAIADRGHSIVAVDLSPRAIAHA